MPVTKTARRALRSSKRKEIVNKARKAKYEIAIRKATKTKSQKDTREAMSLVDRAAKNNVIHKNKAARIKSKLSKLQKPEKKSSTKKA